MGSRTLMNLRGRHADTEQADPIIVPRIEKVRALEDVEQQDLAKGLFSTLELRCLSPSLARCLSMDVNLCMLSRNLKFQARRPDMEFIEYLQVEAYVNDLVKENCPEVDLFPKGNL